MQKTNILEYLEETALRYPDKIAMRDGAYSLTFKDLLERAEAIGSFLLSKKINRKAVAVLMDRHPDTVCAFSGVLYAGCFYICIDPEFPDIRICDIMDGARAEYVICSKASSERARLLSGRAEVFCFDDMIGYRTDRTALANTRAVSLDIDPAYIVFTSGTSGKPKGVCASHRSVIDYAEALTATLGFDADTVFGNQAPLYYDAPLKELLPMLLLGCEVVFIPRELFLFPVKLCEFIHESGVNTLCFAASLLARISSLGALDICDMSFLKTVCFGSEPLSRREFDRWRRACPDTRFINLYGSTECTGMSAYWIADGELEIDGEIPIGQPFPNTEILLINDDGMECNAEEVGEIYIRGGCVTLGYYENNAETLRSYVQNPLNSAFPDIIYRTGDMARKNHRGELIYLGRRDRQIKLSGRRIEPSEIERTAERCRGISSAALIFDNERSRLVLFYVGDAEKDRLSGVLCESLPDYMRPKELIRLDAMPQKPNGKLDRSRLYELLEGYGGKCNSF